MISIIKCSQNKQIKVTFQLRSFNILNVLFPSLNELFERKLNFYCIAWPWTKLVRILIFQAINNLWTIRAKESDLYYIFIVYYFSIDFRQRELAWLPLVTYGGVGIFNFICLYTFSANCRLYDPLSIKWPRMWIFFKP